jgi:hypothetical protein
MKYAAEIGLAAMISKPSALKVGSGVQKSIKWIHRHADSIVISYKGKVVLTLN